MYCWVHMALKLSAKCWDFRDWAEMFPMAPFPLISEINLWQLLPLLHICPVLCWIPGYKHWCHFALKPGKIRVYLIHVKNGESACLYFYHRGNVHHLSVEMLNQEVWKGPSSAISPRDKGVSCFLSALVSHWCPYFYSSAPERVWPGNWFWMLPTHSCFPKT